ncbi:TlpA disulfide reductase family protein [Porticoccus sp. W117]|uniref:TlpA family protein disulfide reductase n=1 Tax=Porticoccus sp. W117 TaxID=3054777 RepID=UPI002596DF1A|nr:TlpA disulfide reductase family protein [Porticoccus sp. W117]MDM3871200.1 TlpA disulfide reductase family protein [Porticoccus sp. W117]
MRKVLVAGLSFWLSLSVLASDLERKIAEQQVAKALVLSDVFKARYKAISVLRNKYPKLYKAQKKTLDAEIDAFDMPRYVWQAIELMDKDASGEAGFLAMKLISRQYPAILPNGNQGDMPSLNPVQLGEVFTRLIDKALSEHIDNPNLIEVVGRPAFYLTSLPTYNIEAVYDYQKSVWSKIIEGSEHRSVKGTAAYLMADYAIKFTQISGLPEELKRQAKIDVATYSNMSINEYGDVVVRNGKTAREIMGGRLFALDALVAGKELPDVEAKTLKGKLDQLSNYRGKVVLVDFWATWCGPCIATFPAIAQLKKELAGKPFEVISINVDDEVEDAIAFKENSEQPMPWVNWHIGPDSPILTEWAVNKYPTFFVLDEKGIIQITDFDSNKIKELVNKLAE